MSRVTHLMVSVLSRDADNVEIFATWLREKPAHYLRREDWPADELERDLDAGAPPWPYSGDLSKLPDAAWPGPKYATCQVWAGLLNGADMELVRKRFAEIPWVIPNAVQMFVLDFEEAFFRLWMIRGGRLTEYSPGFPLENAEEFWP